MSTTQYEFSDEVLPRCVSSGDLTLSDHLAPHASGALNTRVAALGQRGLSGRG
jgi:hypothetical protein